MIENQSLSMKTRSQASCSSRHSSRSSTNNAAAIARAKAEAAKARLSFAEEEMKMKMEKAHLEASIEKLNVEKETAAAVAEAEALEAAANGSEEQHSSKHQLDATPLDPVQRTRDYVSEQAKECEHRLNIVRKTGPVSQDEVGRLYTEPTPLRSVHAPHLKTDCLPAITT